MLAAAAKFGRQGARDCSSGSRQWQGVGQHGIETYHCAGTNYDGKTKAGAYMGQGEGQARRS
jgi:hypothetical protein